MFLALFFIYVLADKPLFAVFSAGGQSARSLKKKESLMTTF
jgi:hypothetical protein